LALDRRWHCFSCRTWRYGQRKRPLFHTPRSNGPLVLLTRCWRTSRLLSVAAYSDYLGATVTVQYRLGDVVLSATGVLVGDSGRSIFLEQHLEQGGKRNCLRWEIPYLNVHAIEGKIEAAVEIPAAKAETAEPARASAAAAAGHQGASSILPLTQTRKAE